MRILLVEDDLMLGDAVKEALENKGNVVDWMIDAQSCESALKTTKFEIILLDINLPDKSGLEILKLVRSKKNDVPILIITARDAVSQKIEGLDLGADDYLSKPFVAEELFARIRSLIRRNKGISTSILTYKDIKLNTVNHIVTKNESKISLIPKEFNILKTLLENIDKVISKTYFEEMLYSWEDGAESNTVEVYIHRLRKKLGQDLIRTIRGAGYIIEKE